MRRAADCAVGRRDSTGFFDFHARRRPLPAFFAPIEIAAVVVQENSRCRRSTYKIADYKNFVHVQTESAVRQRVTSYPYDLQEERKIALRSHATEINQHLKEEIEARLQKAGLPCSNLLVVLRGERGTQRVVNTGTLYG